MVGILTVVVLLSACQGSNNPLQGTHTRRVTVGELQRTYVIHVPERMRVPAPVILAFHGGFGTPQTFEKASDLTSRGNRAGFVVVYPAGYKRSWNAGDCCGPAQREGVDDVAFVAAVLEDLASLIDVDRRRVFAAGFSNGAKLVYRLGCELADRIAAIAPAGSAMSVSAVSCQPARPLPVLHFHGTLDRVAPFHGGTGTQELAGEQRSVPDTIGFWVRHNRCSTPPRVVFNNGAATCVTYPGCQQDADVTLCVVNGMGHQWPGFTVRSPKQLAEKLGPGTDDISATDMLLEFFQHHPLSP